MLMQYRAKNSIFSKTEDLFMLNVYPTDKWEDINGIIEESMKHDQKCVQKIPAGDSECIVRDKPFDGIEDKGFRRARICRKDEIPIKTVSKISNEHAMVLELDTSEYNIVFHNDARVRKNIFLFNRIIF